jgi:hypothetical protein
MRSARGNLARARLSPPQGYGGDFELQDGCGVHRKRPCQLKFMVRPILENIKRGRGRPATGHDPAVTVRIQDATLLEVDHWAADLANRRKGR